jgi:hypothetical protein
MQNNTLNRSSFSEEFRDAAGFGWALNGMPPHDLKSLIEKKVWSGVRCILATPFRVHKGSSSGVVSRSTEYHGYITPGKGGAASERSVQQASQECWRGAHRWVVLLLQPDAQLQD